MKPKKKKRNRVADIVEKKPIKLYVKGLKAFKEKVAKMGVPKFTGTGGAVFMDGKKVADITSFSIQGPFSTGKTCPSFVGAELYRRLYMAPTAAELLARHEGKAEAGDYPAAPLGPIDE